jgi:hypothetical protein
VRARESNHEFIDLRRRFNFLILVREGLAFAPTIAQDFLMWCSISGPRRTAKLSSITHL